MRISDWSSDVCSSDLGPTVMLRADMDALPIAEDTGLTYASKVTATDAEGNVVPVAHMCGHDMHVAWLVGAATLLSQARDGWQGTLMAAFQHCEDRSEDSRVGEEFVSTCSTRLSPYHLQ